MDTIVLLIGETGAGKSTFLNYVANYFLKGSLSQSSKYDKVVTVIPTAVLPKVTHKIAESSENSLLDKTKSKTSKPTLYTFRDDEYNSDAGEFTIIDTPGFNDTNPGSDEKNLESVLNVAANQPFLSAIVLLINGTLSRETTSLKYVLRKIKGSVPDSLLNNIFIVFTNCNQATRNFDLSLLSEFTPAADNIFHMQNNAFSNDHSQNDDKRLWHLLEFEWANSMDTIEEFVIACQKMNNLTSQDFKKMKTERDKMKRLSDEMIDQMKELIRLDDEIDKYKKEEQEAQDEINRTKNYKTKKTIQVKKMVKTDYYNTVCTTHINDMVCHEHCGLVLQQTTHEHHFSSCAAADSDRLHCRVCKCSMTIHYHVFEIPKVTNEDIDEEDPVLKARYDQALNELNDAQKCLDINQRRKQQFEFALARNKQEIGISTNAIRAICKNFDYEDELENLIENLAKETQIQRRFDKRAEFESLLKAVKSLKM